jgi:hypothetical protein
MRKVRGLKIGGIKIKKNEKKCFAIQNNVFSLLLFLGWSFDFAVQR